MQENSCGREPFALQVLGDSMLPEFADGAIIIVDPEGVISDGSYVMARHGDSYIFRQLVYGEGRYYLKALQDGHEVIELPDLSAIEGVITQQGMRRKHRKYYT